MQEAAFKDYLIHSDLAPKTIELRIYALYRIERFEGLDLDSEFERDGLNDLTNRLSYSTQDEHERRANPTNLNIDPERLRSHLSWYRSHLNSYRKWRSGGHIAPVTQSPNDELAEEAISESIGNTFALERDLQEALRQRIEDLEPSLSIVDGGSERRVPSGFIDILAEDTKGDLVVVELKAGQARPEVVAQILGYMSCIAEEDERNVRGIIVAADFHPRVTFAAKAVPNLMLKRYEYKFEFT